MNTKKTVYVSSLTSSLHLLETIVKVLNCFRKKRKLYKLNKLKLNLILLGRKALKFPKTITRYKAYILGEMWTGRSLSSKTKVEVTKT